MKAGLTVNWAYLLVAKMVEQSVGEKDVCSVE